MRVLDDYLIGVHDPVTDELDGSGWLSNLGFPIYDSQTQIDPMTADKVVVSYPVPFATYSSSIGDDDNRRLNAAQGRRSVFFSFTYVGETRQQAKWAGELIRARLKNHRPVLVGHNSWPISILTGGSQRVRRDDAVMRPDGTPLFYGIDDYAGSITVK